MAKRLGTTAVKNTETRNAIGGGLPDDQTTNFRVLVVRANCLALDRPDLARASKELCRAVARPTTADVIARKRMVRQLIHQKKLLWLFPWGGSTNIVDVYVDTDFAGCHRTRRSTSGGAITMGSCTMKHRSQTQSTIALSSGEAELGGIVKAASLRLGFKSMAADLGVEPR